MSHHENPKANAVQGRDQEQNCEEEHEQKHGHAHGHGATGNFKNVEELAAKFDDPSRDEWQKPEEILDFIQLKPTDKFADIGAGTGYFSTRAARRLQDGTVLAIDSEPEMLNYIQKRAVKDGLSNVKTLRIDNNRITLPEQVDVLFLLNTFHHIDDRIAYFCNLKPWLKSGGKLIIVEGKLGTPMEPPEELRVTTEQIVSELKAAGYGLVSESDILPYQSLQMFKLK